jgi:flavodoxin
MEILIVYYSRTGRTKKIAETIQSAINCEIERIQDLKNREGIIGWFSAGREAARKSTTKIKNVQYNPSEYEVVIIGSPTWNGHVSVPIRTYIQQNQEDLTNVALFSTGDVDKWSAIEDMKEMIKKRVLISMHLIREDEIDNNKYHKKVGAFVEKIKSSRIY